MKIAFMISTLSIGGAERVITNLANKYALMEEWDVYVIVKYVVEKEFELHPRIKRINLFSKNNVFDVCRHIDFVRNLCRRDKIDILINFMAASNIKGILATVGIKTKCVISVRDDPNREYNNLLLRFLSKMLFPFADGVVFQTQEEEDWFGDTIRKKSTIIPNPVTEKFYLSNAEYCSIEKRDNIVAIGRLESQKNHKMLLEAFKRIHREFPFENLVIYGEGSLQRELENKIKKDGLDGYVHMAGAVEDIQKHIKNAKMFVMPSNHEGLPNAMLEAMALGLPIICTDCPGGGPREYINDGLDGLLVNVGDVDGLVRAMRRMLSNPEWSYCLGAAARKKAALFREEVVFKKWERYILSCINGDRVVTSNL